MDPTPQLTGKRKTPGGDVVIPPANSKPAQDPEAGKKEEASAVDASGMDIETALKFYYNHFFPYSEMCEWLSYEDSKYFYHREFSFTIDETYIRYQSFRNESELKRKLKSMCPHKIDIGAVYTLPAAQHASIKKEAFHTVERELVFDIDLTDYDDVRTCCSGASICHRCWQFMTVAVKTMDRGLREDFGFKHLLWVFSGRRGIHCWVCDKRARELSDAERTALVEYFTLITGGGEKSGTRVAVTYPLLPSQRRAFKELEAEFVRSVITVGKYGRGVGMLEEKEQWDKMLERVPDFNGLRGSLSKVFEGNHSALFRWKTLKKSVADAVKVLNKIRNLSQDQKVLRAKLRKCIPDIVFAYIYPRLDADVSKHQNHLLKSPFCVHPKTGKVCIPMDPAAIDDFDPMDVPNVYQLAASFTEAKDQLAALKHSTLAPHVAHFKKHFLAGLHRENVARKRREAEESAAETGDW